MTCVEAIQATVEAEVGAEVQAEVQGRSSVVTLPASLSGTSANYGKEPTLDSFLGRRNIPSANH